VIDSSHRALHVSAGNLFGGIERMLLAIAGWDASPWTHDIAVCFDGRLASGLRDTGRPPHVLGDVRFRRPDSVWRARRALRQVLQGRRHDLVIGHAPWSYALAVPVARRLGLPMVLWTHDAPDVKAWPERRVSRMPPDRVLCNSRYIDALVQHWLATVPRSVIYPPVAPSPALDPAQRRRIRGELGAPDQTTIIVIASRLERWKGHSVLLRAAAQLRGDFGVWIVGSPQRPHEEEYLRELHDLASDAALQGRVRFVTDSLDARHLIAAADVHCQPNEAPEPFGIAFVEALSAGVPVVTTAFGAASEIVDESCGVLVRHPQPALFASALQQLIDHPAHRLALGGAGPAAARRVSDPAARLRDLGNALHLLLGPVAAA
jgi:glycosyltransferase involved in cell wall biosynthesis